MPTRAAHPPSTHPALLLALAAPACMNAAARPPTDPTACFTEVVTTLSTDEMEGRGIGTPGLEKAASYIQSRMKAAGLKDGAAGFRQPFSVLTGVALGTGNLFTGAGHTYGVGTDYTPLGFSSSSEFAGDVVFAGYGITAVGLGYDDYAGLDVAGKVVLAMRYEPGEADAASPFDGNKPSHFSDLRFKAIRARELGARALVLVSPARSADEPDKLPPLKIVGPISQAGLPVLQVTRAVADQWLAAVGTTLAQAQAGIDRTYKPASRTLPGISVTGRTDLTLTSATAANVIGVLPGRGALADEIVVVGAHYDHLGHGGHGSLRPDSDAIHNGADDNASGVAAMLCGVQQKVAAWKKNRGDRRTLVSIAFAAEELGLGGSGWYVGHPTAGAMGMTTAMVNLDMVGRLRDNTLAVLGTNSAPEWKSVMEPPAAALGLQIKQGGDGYGPSDQTSFYEEGVPVVHLFTGSHDEYHTPDDDAPLLNMEGGGEVAQYLGAVLDTLTHQSTKLTWARATEGAPMVGDSRGYGAYFGSVPDYTSMEGATGGVKLADTRPHSPAEHAGLQKGDVIVNMAGVTIDNLYDMTFVLREHKPNETVEVVYLRGGQRFTTHAVLSVRSEAGAGPKPATDPANPTTHVDFSVGVTPYPETVKGWAPKTGRLVPELLRPEETHLKNLRRITFGGENAEAYWSPDGQHLILQRTPPADTQGATTCDQQYTLDLNTGDYHLLSSGQGRTTCGYYSWPDGKRALYATTEAGGATCPAPPDHSQGYVWALYPTYDIVWDDLAGHRTPFLPHAGYDAEATVCMKNGRVVFTSTRDGDIDLYTANADGSNLKRVTNTPGYDGGAYFTTDCTRIVWRASRPTGAALEDYRALLAANLVRPTSLDIMVMDADGTKPVQLTHNGAANFGPYPTPDDKGIVYASNAGADPREFDLYVVGYDASEPRRVTFAPGFDGFPMYSPDGRWLVFASNRANAPGGRDTDLYIAEWVP